jgi:hypothetical protein
VEGKIASPEQNARQPSREIDASSADPPGKAVRAKSAHLMCGTALWGFAGAAAYFSYLSYAHLSSGDYSWVHNWWTVLTYAVWVVLITGLLTETRCWRERIFFGLVMLTFLLGFAFSAWSNAPEHAVRQLRVASTLLWALAAVASLTTTFGSKPKTGDAQRDSPEAAK